VKTLPADGRFSVGPLELAGAGEAPLGAALGAIRFGRKKEPPLLPLDAEERGENERDENVEPEPDRPRLDPPELLDGVKLLPVEDEYERLVPPELRPSSASSRASAARSASAQTTPQKRLMLFVGSMD
jgi:hypothetical protein